MNNSGFASFFEFNNVDWTKMGQAIWETVWMTVVSMIAVAIFGIILGLILFETQNSNSIGAKIVNWVVAALD